MEHMPSIIYLKGESKDRILLKYPDLKSIVSDDITKSTVIMVDNSVQKSFVMADNDDKKGIFCVNEVSFEYMLVHLREMVSKLKHGVSLKIAMTELIFNISKSGGKNES